MVSETETGTRHVWVLEYDDGNSVQLEYTLFESERGAKRFLAEKCDEGMSDEAEDALAAIEARYEEDQNEDAKLDAMIALLESERMKEHQQAPRIMRWRVEP